jgi:4-diphosphocytidyl-2-C-methyl-D-erythritol kinase
MTKRLELSTPAKINLFLRVVGRRPDGYHELDSVFLPISLFDRVVVKVAQSQSAQVSITCNWRDIPLDERNLAVRAAQSFIAHAGLRWRVAIDLHKEIPAGAGLGGGSSDAGAMLRAMSSMHPTEPAVLSALALKLGADVPFFLDPRPARVSGVGERIANLPGSCRLHLVVGVPPVAVPTAEIYRHLEPRDWSGRGPSYLPVSFDIRTVTRDLLVNDLQRPAMALYPQVATVKVILESLGAAGVAMSGSGGAVFGVFESLQGAGRAADAAAARMPEARFFVVESLADRQVGLHRAGHIC